MSKHRRKINKVLAGSDKSQRGVTLLLTLMILAAISAIVFSISIITLNEVKTSSDEINSEPAITAAEGKAEDMLYTDIRGLDTSCTGTPLNETFPSSGVRSTFENSYYYPGTYNVTVPASSSLALYLYDPCLPGNPAHYTSIMVQLGIPGNANVALCSWALATCQTSPDVASDALSAGQSTPAYSLDPSSQYQLILTNTTAAPESFGLTTTSDTPAIVTGMPAPFITIITTGSLGGVTRKIQTLLPPSY